MSVTIELVHASKKVNNSFTSISDCIAELERGEFTLDFFSVCS